MMLTAHTDGASKGNPGIAAIGYTVEKDGDIIEEYSEFIGETTNNVAEYKAICAVLRRLSQLEATEITLYSDSELAVRQITGVYKVKNPGLKPHYDEVMTLLMNFESYKIVHILRGANANADKLANIAIDEYKAGK